MSGAARNFTEVGPQEVVSMLEHGEGVRLIDVREPLEHRIASVKAAELVPLSDLPGIVDRLDRGEEIVVMCHHGIRSASACAFLVANGFTRVRNLAGGIDRWSVEVDPNVPRY